MRGPVVLVGSGEFTPSMEAVDAELLAATGRPRPRVAVVPTASWPDGPAVFERWAEMGTLHFERLGAEVEQVLIRDRATADDDANAHALGEADLIYLSGGKPDHLLAAFAGSASWAAATRAHAAGAILAGCSAGAMVLAGRQFAFRGGKLPFPLRWDAGLGVVPGIAVIPHYDAFPEPLSATIVLQAPPDVTVLGIDEETALVGRDGAWQVRGRGRVTLWRHRERIRHRDGATFRLGPAGTPADESAEGSPGDQPGFTSRKQSEQ